MPTVYVNDKPVEIGADEKLNCIQAAARAGQTVPSYCWHPELSVVASCRMCLVEVGDKKPDGSVVMQPKLFPGCQTPVKDGTVIVTESAKVKAAQAGTLEYLLLNHPLDCPVCDQAGECGLQDYSFKYGRGYSRLNEPKNIKPDKDYIGDQITLFTDRCIMCTRCVRFTREISGTAELQVTARGSEEEIDIFPGQPCNNKLAGNVVDLCPVGALCSKDFLYEQRVWWLQTKDSVCPGCSTGCSIKIDQNKDTLYRLRPRENEQAQGHFMCDEGRFGWKYIHSEQRLKTPLVKTGSEAAVPASWETAAPAVRQALQEAIQKNGKKAAAVISPWATIEEAYLLAKLVKGLSADVTLALGPVRVEGVDDQYPKGVDGKPTQPVRFTIRAEKCPNRAGVEAVLKQFQGKVIGFDQFAGQADKGEFETIYVLGGDPAGFTAAEAGKLAKAKLLIVQDLLTSPLSEKAQYVLPGGAWAEKEGTFANHNGLAQAIHRALRGPEDARPDGRILWELAGRKGLFHAPTLRQEIAGEVAGLAALIVGDVGETGIFLKHDGAAAEARQPAGSAAQ